jgi:CubicO group peptidase (beta-lactamase class C family)
VLVAKGERVLAEQARPGFSVDHPTNIKSVSKSIVGALVGIAIRDGDLEGVGQPVSEVLPEALVDAAPGSLRDIRIEHLLTMTAGLETTSFENYGAWVTSSNWLRAAARQPVVAAPGERFIYSTGGTHLLGAALAEATGQPLPIYARRVLFEPLEIQADWELDPQGYALSGNNLAMSPRDLLRFGQMMAAGGRWSDRQIVPSSWVESSTSRHSEGWERYGAYGYLWWLPSGEPELWMAAGFGSQLLLVAPDTGVVVVVTASLESKGAEWDGSVLDAVRGFIQTVSRS